MNSFESNQEIAVSILSQRLRIPPFAGHRFVSRRQDRCDPPIGKIDQRSVGLAFHFGEALVI
jgi:hypothetical protein